MRRLSDYTPARVELGRAGGSLPTRALLEFQLAHAKARDAVHLPLAVSSLVLELKQKGITSIPLTSAARDRGEYLKRPDLGRRLSDDAPDLHLFHGKRFRGRARRPSIAAIARAGANKRQERER